MVKVKMVALALTGLLIAGTSHAALFDRGRGLLYDDVLNVTWLQDANYAKTSGYDADGRMTWTAAKTWAANLVIHDNVRNVDYSDWRLASISPVGEAWNYSHSYDGSTDWGYNITSTQSELSYMYYVNLGLTGFISPDGVDQTNYGIFGDGTRGDGRQKDIGLVKNLQSYSYWSGTPYAFNSASDALYYGFDFGAQDKGAPQYFQLAAWAVRSGDVAPVPEPESYVLMFAGLGFLGLMVRRKKHKSAAASKSLQCLREPLPPTRLV